MAQKKMTNDDVQQGLRKCSVWVNQDGEIFKDCKECPYRDDDDPCGINCGEKLMKDANLLIDIQKQRILDLETQLINLNNELIKMIHRK